MEQTEWTPFEDTPLARYQLAIHDGQPVIILRKDTLSTGGDHWGETREASYRIRPVRVTVTNIEFGAEQNVLASTLQFGGEYLTLQLKSLPEAGAVIGALAQQGQLSAREQLIKKVQGYGVPSELIEQLTGERLA